MDELSTQHPHGGDSPIGRTSRRSFLIAAATAGMTVAGIARHSAVTAEDRASFLSKPGSALEPARRLQATQVTTTMPSSTATTTSSTIVDEGEGEEPAGSTTTTTLDAPADGEILFPIIVGENDFCLVTDSFGDCRGSGCSRLHAGVDIMADHLLPVRSPVAGRLTNRYDDEGKSYGSGHGWTLVSSDGAVTFKFFHLDSHEPGLSVDDEVVQGQVIGYVGNTGTSGVSSGTNHHLHFEYRPNNVAADPFHRLQRPPFVDFAN